VAEILRDQRHEPGINVQTRGGDWMSRTQEEARMLIACSASPEAGRPRQLWHHDGGSLVDLFKRITGALAASMIGIVAVFLVIGAESDLCVAFSHCCQHQFMITTPPITRNTATMPIIDAASAPVIRLNKSTSDPPSMVPKLSEFVRFR